MINKKGNLYMAATFAFLFFLVGMLMLPFIENSSTSLRTNLNCASNTISDGTKLVCLMGDTVVPYFIVGVLMLAGGFIGNNLGK